MRILILSLLALASPVLARQVQPGVETRIAFAAGGGLRDWQRGASDDGVLYVRDRTEQWYRVTLAGKCRLDHWYDALIYTTDASGAFDRFSTLSVSSYPDQVCGVASVTTSAPPPGRPGHRTPR